MPTARGGDLLGHILRLLQAVRRGCVVPGVGPDEGEAPDIGGEVAVLATPGQGDRSDRRHGGAEQAPRREAREEEHSDRCRFRSFVGVYFVCEDGYVEEEHGADAEGVGVEQFLGSKHNASCGPGVGQTAPLA